MQNVDFYKSLYAKIGVYQSFGDPSEVNSQTDSLIGYYRGKNQLDHKFFSKQAILHLAEVKQLLEFSSKLLYLTGFASLVLLVLLVIKKRYESVLISAIISSTATIAFMILLSIGTLNFFDPLFVKFHELFFKNNLWLFPPDDNLIKLFPQQFFIEFASRLAINIIITSATIAIVSWVLKKNLKLEIRN